MTRVRIGVPLAILVVLITATPSASASFGIVPGSFTTAAIERDGTVDTRAGSHPFAYTVSFAFNKNAKNELEGFVRDVIVDLPAGLVGDPSALPRCPRQDFDGQEAFCPGDTQVGVVRAVVGGASIEDPVFNLVPPPGVAARIGFSSLGFNSLQDASLAPGAAAGGYGVVVSTNNVPTTLIGSVTETIWGVPPDKAHDPERHCVTESNAERKVVRGCSSDVAPRPFLRLPTSCEGPLATVLNIDSTEAPGEIVTAQAFSLDAGNNPIGLFGCERLPFEPTIQAQLDTAATSSPAGLRFDLHLPQSEEPEGLATSDLKGAVVTLPEGVTVNPSAANGLQACSPAQIALESPTPAACPPASKIGNVQVETPLLEHPLPGGVYLAAQEDNPFGSLLAIYIAVDDPITGVVVKLAGEVKLNPETGQLTTTFKQNPQLPFENFKLEFFGGPHAALVTPQACGTYATTTDLTPWSSPEAPDKTPSDTFTIDEGCGPAGFGPSFTAGTLNPQAGAFSPFVLSFSRNDPEQEFMGLEQTLPPGLLAKLAGVPLCGNTEAAAGACPAASQIGTVNVTAGVGSSPVSVPGTIYLTGPYNGGPFGEVVEVPAIAGPFNLDENGRPVTIRGSIRVNPTTAQATVVSDPFPQKLRGISLHVRTVDVTLNRPGFTFNPTNCSPLSITATLTSAAGTNANVSSSFEAANCAALPFTPSLTSSTSGVTSKAAGASLTVSVVQDPGDANIRKVEVQLPLDLPARLTTLQKACTEGQFAANPAGCPEGSVIGTAIAHTPILSAPLVGPAYLVSHGGAAFPDVEFILQGENGVQIVLDGKTDIKKGITYSRFETVPDAPVSSFETILPEGPHSVLAANGNLCAPSKRVLVKKRVTVRVHGRKRKVTRTVRQIVPVSLLMPTTIVGQNGASVTQSTKIAVTGCPRAKKAAKKKRNARAGK
jgi:hypothetical protein